MTKHYFTVKCGELLFFDLRMLGSIYKKWHREHCKSKEVADITIKVQEATWSISPCKCCGSVASYFAVGPLLQNGSCIVECPEPVNVKLMNAFEKVKNIPLKLENLT